MTEQIAVPKHLHVGAAWAGIPVFEAVRRAFPEVSPREIFRQARIGDLTRNDRRCHPLEPLREGDRVRVLLHREAAPRSPVVLRRDDRVVTPAGPFWLVREDEDLLVVSKPPGCASHPALGHSGDTLIERVRGHLGVRPEAEFQPALANRLDIETSGLVLIAKTRNAQRRLGRHFQRGAVHKRYLTLVGGWPDPAAGEIRLPLLRRADSRDLARLPEGDPRRQGRLQDAVTRYRTVRRLEQPLHAAVLEVELITGRTHQIRRHLAEMGHPLAGDRRYGDPELNRAVRDVGGLTRMFLHAHRLELAHPASGEPLEVIAPLPEDLASCLRSLGAEAGDDALDLASPPAVGGTIAGR